jgi:hypothetical protein
MINISTIFPLLLCHLMIWLAEWGEKCCGTLEIVCLTLQSGKVETCYKFQDLGRRIMEGSERLKQFMIFLKSV